MIRGNVDDSQVIQRFTKLPAQVIQALVPTLDKIGYNLVTHVVRDKLSGQVLKRRSGRLSNSITKTPVEVIGNTVSVRVGVFSGVPYARIHEYGGQINVPEVSGKLMVFSNKQGSTVFTMRHKAFTVNMPERSYLRSSLADQRDQIIAQITKTVTSEQ